MNDHDLDQILDAVYHERANVTDLPQLHERALAVPYQFPRHRGWLPRSPQWRFQSLFSATKFVVAGAIVALFGGFLLSGVLTQQQSDDRLPAVGASATATAQAEPTDVETTTPEPTTEADSTTTTPDLLPGVDLVTEEVEPGVYRVLSDGAGYDLAGDPPVELTVGPGGEVVLFGADSTERDDLTFSTVHVLGQEALWDARAEIPGFWPSNPFRFDTAVDHEGSLWATLEADRLGRHDGLLGRVDTDAWTLPTWPDGSSGVNGIEVTDDGAVWLTQSTSGSGPKVARIVDGEWTVLPVLRDGSSFSDLQGYVAHFAAAPDGTAWLATGTNGSEVPGLPGLLHFDGERWAAVELPVDPGLGYVGPLAVGSDGTLWVYAAESTIRIRGAVRPRNALLRLQEGQWSVFDDVPVLTGPGRWDARPVVDANGTLWIAFAGRPDLKLAPPLGPPGTLVDHASRGVHGVLAFDGADWRQFLKGHLVNRVAVAPDGSVWATSLYGCEDVRNCELSGEAGGGLYVITHEAVAGTE